MKLNQKLVIAPALVLGSVFLVFQPAEVHAVNLECELQCRDTPRTETSAQATFFWTSNGFRIAETSTDLLCDEPNPSDRAIVNVPIADNPNDYHASIQVITDDGADLFENNCTASNEFVLTPFVTNTRNDCYTLKGTNSAILRCRPQSLGGRSRD